MKTEKTHFLPDCLRSDNSLSLKDLKHNIIDGLSITC